LIEEKEVILVFNKLENYPATEIEIISRFLSKIASLNPYRIHLSLHLTFNKDLEKYLTGLGKIANLTGPFTVPLPDSQEAQEILTKLARQNNLSLSPKQIKKIISRTGSHVVLIRTAIREILGNKNLLKNVSLVSKTSGFNLKLKALNETLPQNLQRKTDGELSVKNSGEISDLSKTQEKILEAFIQKKNNILLRDDIAQIIWGENSFDKFSDWAINKTVSRLRSKLIAHGYPSEILTTIKGRGYQYVS